MNKNINKKHKYQLVSDIIVGNIESEKLDSGDKLPSERELAEQFDLSRMTARNVYLKLERDGYISRLDRQGWFVSPTKLRYELARSASFVGNIVKSGLSPKIQVLQKGIFPYSKSVADALQLTSNEEVILVRRLFSVKTTPSMVERLYISGNRFPDFMEKQLNRSIVSIWERDYGVELKSTLIDIRLEALTNADCSLLAVSQGTVGLNLSQVFSERKGRPVGFSDQSWRGDVAEFSFAIDYEKK